MFRQIIQLFVIGSLPFSLVACGASPFEKKSSDSHLAPMGTFLSASAEGQWTGKPNLQAAKLSGDATLSMIAIPVTQLSVISGIPGSTTVSLDSDVAASVIQPELSACDATGIGNAIQLSDTQLTASGTDRSDASVKCTSQLLGFNSGPVVLELKNVPVTLDHVTKATIVTTLTVTLRP